MLRRQVDGGGRSPRDVIEALGLRAPLAPDARPKVAAAMIASADGRATVQGRSVALGHPADRALLRELRAGADAILVGAATMAAERYATLLDPDQRAMRAARGEPEHPLIVTISRRLDLSLEIPVLHERGVEVLVFTESDAPPPRVGGQLYVHRFAPGTLTLTRVLHALGERGVRGVACEGGPSLLGRLVAEGALDHLLLTVAPLLAAGDAPSILEGPAFAPPVTLALREIHRADDHVFLHYGAAR